MMRRRYLWFGIVVTLILAHLALSSFPNRDDAAAAAIEEAGGKVRRTPRLFWLAVFADAPDAFYPHGDAWDVEIIDAEIGPRIAHGLSTLRSLECLALHRCRIPPGMTANLVPPSKELRTCSVFDTNLRDTHISGLDECPRLIYLILKGTEVTDASVPTITRCKRLSYIVLKRNKFTENGIAAIRDAFPQANVVTDDVPDEGRE